MERFNEARLPQASTRSKALVDAAPFMVALLEGPDHALRYANHQFHLAAHHRPLIGLPLRDALPELRQLLPVLDRIREAERAHELSDAPIRFHELDPSAGADWNLDWCVQPLHSEDDTAPVALYALGAAERVPAYIGSLFAQDLRRMCRLSSNIFVVVGSDGRFRRISPNFTELLGWTPEEVLASPTTLFVHAKDRERTRLETERLSLGAQTGEFVIRTLHKDGSIRWIAWTTASIPEEDAIYAVGRDVTESRRYEKALLREAQANAFRVALTDTIRPLERAEDIQREAARLIGEHFKVSRVNFATIRDDSAVVEQEYANHAPSLVGRFRIRDFGVAYNRESMAGRTLVVGDVRDDPRLSPEEREAHARIEVVSLVVVPLIRRHQLAAVLSVSHTEARNWSDTEVALLEEAGERTWSATERAEAEETMRKSEELYRLISRATNDVIWDLNPQSGRLTWNESLHSQLGFGPEEISTLEEWYRRIHPEERDRVEQSFKAAVEAGEETWVEEYRLQRRDGEYSKLLDRGHLARDGSGRLYRVIGSILDLTERHKAEESLRELNAQLVESDRRKDEFLAMLAHELRNPLAAVRNAVQLLGGSTRDSRSQRYLEILQRQSGHLSGMVDDLMDVSRVTRGLIMLKHERVNLSAVASQALESVRLQMEGKRHDVKLQLPERPLVVYGDPVRLEQILVNLLSNAAKYTDPGGKIALRVTARGDWAELRVTDTGVGIAPEVQRRIFNLFGQAERSLDRSQGGLGIGLTIVKSLVDLHGGNIEVHSEGIGKGAEFLVRLPLAAREEARPEIARPMSRITKSSKKILVVEDHPDVAETLGLLLSEAGHQVTAADTGVSALAKADDFEPDIVLLDIGLPGMDGYEVARRLRENPHTRGAVLAAVTGYGQASDREQARAAGFNAHFVKPVNFAALSAFISNAQPGAG